MHAYMQSHYVDQTPKSRKFDMLASKHVNQFWKLMKRIQDSRSSRDNDAIKVIYIFLNFNQSSPRSSVAKQSS